MVNNNRLPSGPTAPCSWIRDELAQICKRYGDRNYKEVDGIALLDPGATFDIVNFGEGCSSSDELIDICIFNHASSVRARPELGNSSSMEVLMTIMILLI